MIFKNENEELFEIIDNEPRIYFKEVSSRTQTLSGSLKKQIKGWRLEVKLLALMVYGQIKAFQTYLQSSRHIAIVLEEGDPLKSFVRPKRNELSVMLSYVGEEEQFLSPTFSGEKRSEVCHVLEIEMSSTELL